MDSPRTCDMALVVTALATAAAVSACAESEPPAEEPTTAATSGEPSPTEMSGEEAAEALCAELSSLLTSTAMLELGFTNAVLDHGPGATEDMVPDPSTPTAAFSIAMDGLTTAALAPDDIKAHVLTLSDAGAAINEVLADNASLADVTDIWYAPEVKEAEEAVAAHYESTC
ncbi:hypothetical protein AB0K52_24380 [Glycomyces sp. NPDC049804]|uniref:hypothetical protein n=1 Tax=Glycomyces sp. NPDC049804 TaxID=3154363 RepID=UPI00342167A8